MKTFNELEETLKAEDIHGQVMHTESCIKIRYKYEGKPFRVELPKTEYNNHLTIGEDIDMKIHLRIK